MPLGPALPSLYRGACAELKRSRPVIILRQEDYRNTWVCNSHEPALATDVVTIGFWPRSFLPLWHGFLLGVLAYWSWRNPALAPFFCRVRRNRSLVFRRPSKCIFTCLRYHLLPLVHRCGDRRLSTGLPDPGHSLWERSLIHFISYIILSPEQSSARNTCSPDVGFSGNCSGGSDHCVHLICVSRVVVG